MKTPNLIDAPKSHPSKADKLKAFKEVNKIWTERSKAFEEDGVPWCALLMPDNPHRKLPYVEGMTDPVAIIAKAGILFEDMGVLAFAKTEREAINQICATLKITPV